MIYGEGYEGEEHEDGQMPFSEANINMIENRKIFMNNKQLSLGPGL
jgi:hypothetical protein